MESESTFAVGGSEVRVVADPQFCVAEVTIVGRMGTLCHCIGFSSSKIQRPLSPIIVQNLMRKRFLGEAAVLKWIDGEYMQLLKHPIKCYDGTLGSAQ